MSGEKLSASPDNLLPHALELIEVLRKEPSTPFECLHGDGAAIGIYEFPGGCGAWPDIETQPLCPQHVTTDGSFEALHLIVDLTVSAAWAHHRSDTPVFYIIESEQDGVLTLVEYPG